jgi:hypothetical protein
MKVQGALPIEGIEGIEGIETWALRNFARNWKVYVNTNETTGPEHL